MTKATAIPQRVKDAVWARDGGMCVLCGREGLPNAHVVRRSQGGRGIEQNVVCLCQNCHRQFDEGRPEIRWYARQRIEEHLREFYPDWNEEDMTYKKWLNED